MARRFTHCIARNAGTGQCTSYRYGRFCNKHYKQREAGIIDNGGKKIREFKPLRRLNYTKKFNHCIAQNSETGPCSTYARGRFCSTHDKQHRNGIIDINGVKIRDKIRQESFLSYIEAKNIVQKERFKSRSTFWGALRPNKFVGVPSNPDKFYKEWEGWGTFLGTGTIAPQCKEFMPYKKAKTFLINLLLPIKTQQEFRSRIKELPVNIPRNPDGVYKGMGWVSWGDFLNNGRKGKSRSLFLSFEEARGLVRSLPIYSEREYRSMYLKGNLPKELPGTPNVVYEDKWRGYTEFLRPRLCCIKGCGNHLSRRKIFWYCGFHYEKIVRQNNFEDVHMPVTENTMKVEKVGWNTKHKNIVEVL